MNEQQMIKESGDFRIPFNITWGIFLISVFGLFLEMLLIRWIGTEIRIFAYLQNTVLVVCFLGLGLGCFTSRQPIYLREMLLQLTVLVLLLAIPFTRRGFGLTSECLSVLNDFLIWSFVITDHPVKTLLLVTTGLFLTFVLMFFILNIFIPIGRLLGRLMDEHPKTIWAYSVNVGGSLVGTWLFVLLSVFYLPPVAWFLVVGILVLFFLNRASKYFTINLLLAASIVLLSWFCGWVPGAIDLIWSPYQKLVMRKADIQRKEIGKYVISVNNTGYQVMLNLSGDNNQKPWHLSEMPRFSQYDIPLLLHPDPKNYLIVGAGTGNDAAGGLRHQIQEIVAVEIDPAIIDLGRRYHPEHPYSSPVIQVVNDDARSFFAKCNQKFDVISFGLLDSHTTTTMTNARLDHYVYTRESLARAKSLLSEGGIMVLSFAAQKPFIADRMARVLKEIFNEEPISFRIPYSNLGWGGVLFISGDLAAARKQISLNPRLSKFITGLQKAYPLSLTYTTKVTTDDWPYIYLKTPMIPSLFFLLAGLMVLLLIWGCHLWKVTGLVTRWSISHWHFFFLGAAFLLLEVQNISKASVVLGNTWEVNAVIITGVLAMILLANFIAYRFPALPIFLVYVLLIATCLALYFLDLARFAFLPYISKAMLVGGLTTLPMLFSGVVFIRSFSAVIGKDQALGANLIGALVGALLQSVTFITGIKALLLIVVALYTASLVTRPSLRPTL